MLCFWLYTYKRVTTQNTFIPGTGTDCTKHTCLHENIRTCVNKQHMCAIEHNRIYNPPSSSPSHPFHLSDINVCVYVYVWTTRYMCTIDRTCSAQPTLLYRLISPDNKQQRICVNMNIYVCNRTYIVRLRTSCCSPSFSFNNSPNCMPTFAKTVLGVMVPIIIK